LVERFTKIKKMGIGDYFWNSQLSDIELLMIYAGIHRKEYE